MSQITSTLSFTVQNGEIIVSSYMGWMTRPNTMLTMFQMLVDSRGHKNIPQINIDLSDTSSDAENYPNVPYFTISARKDNIHKLIPDPYSLCWPEANITNVFAKCHEIELAGMKPSTDPRVFWIGQNSHWTRKQLVEISKKHPDKIDARLLEWKNNVIPENQMTTLEQHTQYKYLIDLSGQGFSARIKYLMFSRRPLFIVDREYEDWISCEMVPWVHFIPVSESDLENDLLYKIDWAERNALHADKIAKNALEFIKARLTISNILDKLEYVLHRSGHLSK